MVRRLRGEILKNLPRGYVERLDSALLVYEIPLRTYPKTYNGKPLCVAALASQKSYVTVYLMAVYGDKMLEAWFRKIYAASGKTLRMGKSCVHFRSMEDIPSGVIGKAIAKVPVKRYIEVYERARRGAGLRA
jgi:hypothetical protein